MLELKDIINVYLFSEHILAWGLATIIGLMFLLLFLLVSFYPKAKELDIMQMMKWLFFFLGIFFIDLSTMPMLLYAERYDIKRYFEFVGTVTLVFLTPTLLVFIRDFINYINKK